MPFTDQSPSFTAGFESGQLWEMMQAGKKFDNYIVHQCNQKQIEMMCQRFGYTFRFEAISSNTLMIIHAEKTN